MMSIITCVYNQREDLFRACVQSVVAQPGPIEWLLVDDGSSPAFANSYGRILGEVNSSHKIDLTTLPSNRGLSFARNEAIKRASGDWIVVLDSDDALATDLAQTLGRLPDSQKLVCFDVDFIRTEGTIERRRVRHWAQLYQEFGLTTKDPFLWFDFYYHGLIARTEVVAEVEGYKDDLVVGEDQDILLRVCEAIAVEQVEFIRHVGYRYRDNIDGVCRQRWAEVEDNYTQTMLAGARRRGASFDSCRFAGSRSVDEAEIDEYMYRDDGRWLRWEDI